jgi:heme-degrading monooxygenase HmoA
MATVKMTLTLWTGEKVVSYWQTADDAKAWRKAVSAAWFESKLEHA